MRSLPHSLPRTLDRPLSRRRVHGLIAGAAVMPLAACDLLQDSTPEPPPAPTADELLVERLTSAIRRTRAVAAAATAGRSLVAVHDAHLVALGSTSASANASPTDSPTSAPRTTAQLRAAELRLENRLTAAAGRADDGDLARLLASMAASLAQHVAVLPRKAA